MSLSLKALAEQVVVITGASSGIGLATALEAADQGAKVVLAARSADVLADAVGRIVEAGGEAIYVVADVSRRADVEAIADAAEARFGRIDTWVNDAGVAIYGRLDCVSEDDSRRLFDTNFWGVVNGSLVALERMRPRGGAIINVGSELSETVVPLQGMYAASKHAVKGFTDSLRVETEEIDDAPVAVTLVQPTAVDTPYPQHARNYLENEPKLPSPQIAPERVAAAILDAATHHRRDVRVGAQSIFDTIIAKVSPVLADKLAAMQANRQHHEEPPRHPLGALHVPGGSGKVRGSGAYTKNLSERTKLGLVAMLLPRRGWSVVVLASAASVLGALGCESAEEQSPKVSLRDDGGGGDGGRGGSKGVAQAGAAGASAGGATGGSASGGNGSDGGSGTAAGASGAAVGGQGGSDAQGGNATGGAGGGSGTASGGSSAGIGGSAGTSSAGGAAGNGGNGAPGGSAGKAGGGAGGNAGFVPPPLPTVSDEPPAACSAATGSNFQFLSDACNVRKKPTQQDRDRACPVSDPSATVARKDGSQVTYLPAEAKIAWEPKALVGIVPAAMQISVVLVRRVNGVPHYRYLSNGTHAQAFQPWSSSKFMAVANAAATLRVASDYKVGLTAKVGATPLGDLVTSIHNYDDDPYSSNALGRYFHDIGGRAKANALVHDWLDRPDSETFGGNYGQLPPDLGYSFVAPSGAKVTVPKDTTSGPANHFSTWTAAEFLKRLVHHRENASQRLPGIQWEDLRVLFFGAEGSKKHGAWGGMTDDTTTYIQQYDMGYIEQRSQGQWVTFSKLGNGTAGEFVTTNYACFPQLDPAGAPVPGWGREFLIATHLDEGGSTWKERDRIVAKAYRALLKRIMEDDL